MNDTATCEVIPWSEQGEKIEQPLLYICTLATIIHLLFWIQLITYPTVRQRSMQWLYAYLATDLLLLVRFFLLYAYRSWPACVSHVLRMILCYTEAIFDNYLNLLQSYVLLALNICRYLQIVHNHDVYSSNHRLIISVHLCTYLLPLISHISAICLGWTQLENPRGNACDLLPVSLKIRLLYLVSSYFIPVILTLVFLSLSLNFIRNTDGIRTPEIVDARQRYHRQLVLQSTVFYSLLDSFSGRHIFFSFLFTIKILELVSSPKSSIISVLHSIRLLSLHLMSDFYKHGNQQAIDSDAPSDDITPYKFR